MEKTYRYRGRLERFEGVFAVLLVAAWSVSSIVLVGAQSLPVA